MPSFIVIKERGERGMEGCNGHSPWNYTCNPAQLLIAIVHVINGEHFSVELTIEITYKHTMFNSSFTCYGDNLIIH
jgi:hypothetical protein